MKPIAENKQTNSEERREVDCGEFENFAESTIFKESEESA